MKPSKEELDAAFNAALSELNVPREEVYRDQGYRSIKELCEQYSATEKNIKNRMDALVKTQGWLVASVRKADGRRMAMYRPPL